MQIDFSVYEISNLNQNIQAVKGLRFAAKI